MRWYILSILDTIKKGYLYTKTSAGFLKLLPRTLAELVSLNDGSNLENTISNSVDDNSVDTNANDSIQVESHEKEQNKSIETNCLALTVQKDYNFAIAKNTVFKTIRMSIKVAISTLVLNVIKLFF